MRTLLFILLFGTGFAYAQPAINNPTSLITCDSNYNNGYGIFYLYYKDSEILGSLNPNFYTVSYYSTITDSQTGTNPLPNVTAYANSNPFNQTIYVRVWENANPNNFAFTTLNLVVSPLPILNNAPNLTQIDNDGYASFDLSTINSLLGPLNPSDYIFSYYPTITDAANGTNQILDFSNYTNSINPENVTVKVTNNVTGCYQFSGFNLEVQASDFPINTPTTLSTCGNTSGFGTFDLHSKDAEILGSLNPSNYTVTYYANSNDTFNEQNVLASLFTNTIASYQTIFVRVDENATTSFSTTTLQLYANSIVSIPTNLPSLTVYENPFDGIAIFDLTTQNNTISTNLNSIINYYTSLTDAENQTNEILNPSSFTGIHSQFIWVRLSNPVTTCFSIGIFTLNVVDSSTVVYIPDANFKSKLIALGVDTNSDGEIQFTEALIPTIIIVNSSNISSLTGIEAFTNLESLSCQNNYLTSLNVNNLIHLDYLFISNNQITSIDISNLIYLDVFKCDNNQLQSLNINGLLELGWLKCNDNQLNTLNLSNLPFLHALECYNNQLTSLNVNNLTNLYQLNCNNNLLTSINNTNLANLTDFNCIHNQLTNLNVTTNTALQNLLCYNNQLTSLDVTQNVNLTILECFSNQVSSIDVSHNINLTNLNCFDNLLTSLDVTHNIDLLYLQCYSNQLTSIDVSQNENLELLSCSNNQFTNLNVLNNVNLSYLDCGQNQLTTLEVSQNINLETLGCINNQLTTLFIKNGSIETGLDFSNNPNLTFICADENQISDIQNQLITNGMTNTVVNSYCSFNPGGDYNTITGTVKYDSDNNGCDSNDIVFPNIKMKITQWGINNATFTNQLGNYTFYTTFADQLVAPQIENSSYFNFSPQDASISFPDNNNNVFTQNFCLSPNGTHNDLEVAIMPVTPARPGFDATYKIVYKNKGNQTLSGTVNLAFDNLKTDFVIANPVVDNLTTNSLTWNYSNLLPFESRSITIVLNVNSPIEIPTVNNGDVLDFTTSITPIIGDEFPSDNTFDYNQTVVGSFDPNDITCLEGETVSPSEIGNYLHYAVNFENTGTYEAENVVVKDVIDTNKFDIESLQVMNTSNPAYIKITGNVVEFIFQNINLAPRGGNPPVGGHGNVLFKIKSKNNLVPNDFVEKTAKIYFDYNAPIDTNIAQTTFVSLSNSIPVFDNSVTVYPNPTTGNVTINSDFNIKSIELYDIQGRILETSFENSNTTKLDISGKQKGIYFLKITTENGSKIEKIIKE